MTADQPSKRDRLTYAAAQLFWTKGFAATSLADIADAAGIPLGNVYYYFKTKAALAHAVGDLFVGDMGDELAAIDGREASPRARLTAVLELLSRGAEMRARHGCPIAGAVRDFSGLDRDAADRVARTFAVLEDWLTATIAETGPSQEAARAAAEDAVAAWQGAIVAAQAGRDPARLTRAIGRIAARLGCPAPGMA